MCILKILDKYFNIENNEKITGLTKGLNVFLMLKLLNKYDNIVVLTSTLYEANQYYNILKYYYEKTYIFPMDDFLTSVSVATSPDLRAKRIETIKCLGENKKTVTVTNLTGFLKYLPSVKKQNEQIINISVGDKLSRTDLIKRLEEIGYERNDLVTATGEYAVRGNLVDMYFVNEEHPIRVELDGNIIETIRYFDENTQRSISNIKNYKGQAFNEIVNDDKSSLLDYINNPMVVNINEDQIKLSYEHLLNDILEYNASISSNQKYMYLLEELFIPLQISLNVFDQSKSKRIESKMINNFSSNYELLKGYISDKINSQKKILFCSINKKYIETFMEQVKGSIITDFDNIFSKKVNVIKFDLLEGFEIGDYVVISQNDIEKELNIPIKYTNPLKSGRRIKEISDLNIDDYVVHINHGIGIYKGVVTIQKNNLKKDYLLINYKGNDKVYIPVEKISNIYKYLSKDGMRPRIDSLNSLSWLKTKNNLKTRVKDISEELIKLYSVRKSIVGPIFKDYEEELLFANEFKYISTKDQQKAINDIDLDLKNSMPMDRLLCGDVGFGKTEVAFRAIFKAILNNYQVFYLCPTTILSKQQYLSALDRFKSFPIEIVLLNRFTSVKEAKRITEDLAKGKIDLIFGTHRLLSKDVQFKNLGLLIVDEEQRFGVTHKEKIKHMKNDVNVLTLSATPIPRTFKMALSGLRDLSLIDTPPINRFPVQTYVLEENELLIKDAVYKEMSRKGQVFILCNNTSKIAEKADSIRKLIPEARVIFAHGKMNKTDLEKIMEDYVNYKYDVLICTTIIETGIDIPNANTLIVLGAENFGLSQLYQLRGRVGRSDKIAYAYLFFAKNKIVTEIATKRLEAIKDFTELGSGYKIAMRDLALRGAGDILGSEQAGFVDAVGLELYLKMIEEEMNVSKGIASEEDDENIDESSLIDVETHIADEYVSDETIKIEIHKMINEIYDYNSLVNIKTEIEDRFGKVNETILIYMYQEWFEKVAKRLGVEKVIQEKGYIQFNLPVNVSDKINGEKMFIKAYNLSSKFQIKYSNKRITIKLLTSHLEKHFLIYLIPLLEEIKEEIKDI